MRGVVNRVFVLHRFETIMTLNSDGRIFEAYPDQRILTTVYSANYDGTRPISCAFVLSREYDTAPAPVVS